MAPNLTDPIVQDAVICNSGTATLTATGGNSLFWTDGNGNQLGTGNSFVTPVLNQSTTYYVQSIENGCTSNLVAVNAIVESMQDPIGTGDLICNSGSGVLTASGTGSLTWMDVNGTVLGNGNSFQTPTLIETTTYYVQSTTSSCSSNMVAVDAVVQIVNNPEVTGDTICNSGVAILTATGDGDLTWTDANGAVLGTGSTLTTPSLSETTTFYVQASENNCSSDLVAVDAVVDPCVELHEISFQSSLSLSPNPNNGNFAVSYELLKSAQVEIEIYDQAGNEVGSFDYMDTKGSVNHNISIEHIAPGVYSVRFIYSERSHTKRFIKTNE
jgi:hypothetical protein